MRYRQEIKEENNNVNTIMERVIVLTYDFNKVKEWNIDNNIHIKKIEDIYK